MGTRKSNDLTEITEDHQRIICLSELITKGSFGDQLTQTYISFGDQLTQTYISFGDQLTQAYYPLVI
jgi:deoxyxylulose-5-phosphate synthase